MAFDNQAVYDGRQRHRDAAEEQALDRMMDHETPDLGEHRISGGGHGNHCDEEHHVEN